MLSHFLFGQLHPNDSHDPSQVTLAKCPQCDKKISIFNSACSRFFTPSDLSGIGGMHREHVCTCPAWRREHPCYDCIFINTNPDLEGMRGMDIALLMLCTPTQQASWNTNQHTRIYISISIVPSPQSVPSRLRVSSSVLIRAVPRY
jgi:hypothetical protein